MLPFVSDKAKLFAENFSSNSNLDDSDISSLAFPSRTNLNLHKISLTPMLIKKVITNLDLLNLSDTDCIPMVVLKNCNSELSDILALLFNICLKKFYFPDCWQVSSVALHL